MVSGVVGGIVVGGVVDFAVRNAGVSAVGALF